MSKRRRIWRNLLVAAINAGLEQKRFSLDPGNCPLADAAEARYDLELPGGIPAQASVRNIGFDELRIAVAAWPTEKADQFIGSVGGAPLSGEAYACGWLERKNGRWLQSSAPELSCRRHRAAALVAIEVLPVGYSDRGKFFL